MERSLFRFIWRNSRRQQLVVLAIILLSLPFYFASFDIPKRIINDAIQGKAFSTPGAMVRFLEISLPLPDFMGGSIRLTEGFMVSQLGLLWGLSSVFLVFVMINGAFKYYINVMKGVLGERLLRRMRFVLLDQYLRFRPEDIRGVKPSEAASIIKDEVDPIGGFAGDAFILPAFLSMQALTALIFILVQSFWLGLVAFLVVLIQAVVIPALRREQLRLTQMRQLESRKLAGRVGERLDQRRIGMIAPDQGIDFIGKGGAGGQKGEQRTQQAARHLYGHNDHSCRKMGLRSAVISKNTEWVHI